MSSYISVHVMAFHFSYKWYFSNDFLMSLFLSMFSLLKCLFIFFAHLSICLSHLLSWECFLHILDICAVIIFKYVLWIISTSLELAFTFNLWYILKIFHFDDEIQLVGYSFFVLSFQLHLLIFYLFQVCKDILLSHTFF